MKIISSNEYNHMFKELTSAEQDAVNDTLEFFKENPIHDSLRNHELKRPLSGVRSISVDHDLRIIFMERGNYSEVVLLRVWGHERVYKK